MKHQEKAPWELRSIVRAFFAALLMLGGLVLLSEATSPSSRAQSGYGTRVSRPSLAPAGTPRFFNYAAPPGIADDVGEPSIGCNWKSEQSFSNSMFTIPNGGRVMLFGGFSPELYRATFDDCSSPAKPNWEAKPLLTASTPRAAGDPILFTDHDTGRTFVSQLEGLTPAGSTTDITDDDGDNFTPSEGSSLPSDVDHQTFGGGIFHSGALGPVTAYPNAVYYASQSVADARTALSEDGGLTFGPAFPMYTINDCAGLHGHIKVSPKDGTAYVPNVGCGGSVPFHETGAKQAVIVSEDNGITWNIRPIPDSTTHGNGSADNTIIGTRDPSVSIDADGTVYFVYQAEDRLTGNPDGNDIAGDTHPKVAVSHDHGVTWEPSIDVGANVINGNPIRNATFVTATTGSSGRAAVAFFGTETGGNNWPCGVGDDCSLNVQGVSTGINARPLFTGVWYLYISTTFDAGHTWTTQNVTLGDPIQRGGICGGSTCRNLLDFMDLQIDKQGRILVAGVDGCTGGCVTAPPNSFTAKGFITRQSGGKRMLSQFDPVEPALAGAPGAAANMDGAKTRVQLSWQVPDNGGSPITGYKIYRRNGSSGAFSLLATVPETNFTDTTFNNTVTPNYHITAVNGFGEGPFCHDLVPVIGPVVDPCTLPGILVANDVNTDGSDNDSGQNIPPDPSLNIRQIFVGEPDLGPNVNKLIFTEQLGTNGTVLPNAEWYIIWNRLQPDADFDRFYVAMRSDAAGAITYEYGKFGVPLDTSGGVPNPNSNTPVKLGDVDEGTFDPVTGVIQITLSRSKAENIQPGQSLNAVNGRNFVGRPDQNPRGARNQALAQDITGDNSYSVVGNAACVLNKPPVASLSAVPNQGNPPLLVNFNASLSADPDAGDSIASYTFNFGDGSPEVTQAGPTIAHTYKHGGAFFVTLTVKDSRGLVSANVASAQIKVAAQLFNLSSRSRVQTDDKVMIAGLIIAGSEPKKVIVRGIGPSLTSNGAPFQGRLIDPVLELHSPGAPTIVNDDWKTTQKTEIEASGLAPTDDHEPAIIATLNPGTTWTAVLRGKDNSTGIAVVEVYDLDLLTSSRLANLSTRGFVESGDNVLIGGFQAGPNTAAATRVVIRAIGPTLAQFSVAQPLQDPTLELHNGNGTLIAMNDDWQTTQKMEIEATGLQPKDTREPAIVMTAFEPGQYTAIVRGKGGDTGVALVELYDVQN